MVLSTRACAAFVVAVAVAASGCDTGFCADGEYPGTVVLTADGWRIDGTQGGLFTAGTPAETFAYADGSPFTRCRVIGGIFISEPGTRLVDDDYPVLEELGVLIVEQSFNGEQTIDLIDGFDTVTTLGSIVGTEQVATIDEISGFNNVAEMDTILTAANITGLASLQRVTNGVHAKDMVGPLSLRSVGGTAEFVGDVRRIDLPQLEEVGGDVIVDSTRVAELGFPALQRVGGSVLVEGNSSLERWRGFAPGALIEGDFSARINAPIRDEVFEDWLRESQTEVRGRVTICANRPREEEGESCR
jgi:hypothetical protein